MSQEEWCDVVGYEGIYQVSSYGRVKSFHHDAVHGRILKPQKAHGYVEVMLYQDGEHQIKLIHRLVAEVFLGPQPSPAHEVNHKNGIRSDNRVENLEWVTHAQNIRHAIEDLGKTQIGEAHSQAKLTSRKVGKIRELYATGHYTHEDIAEMFDVGAMAIGKVVRGKRWQHVGRAAMPEVDHYLRGEAHSQSRLTWKDVEKIRRLYAAGKHTQTELSEMFGVTSTAIGKVVRRETWKHVP